MLYDDGGMSTERDMIPKSIASQPFAVAQNVQYQGMACSLDSGCAQVIGPGVVCMAGIFLYTASDKVFCKLLASMAVLDVDVSHAII